MGAMAPAAVTRAESFRTASIEARWSCRDSPIAAHTSGLGCTFSKTQSSARDATSARVRTAVAAAVALPWAAAAFADAPARMAAAFVALAEAGVTGDVPDDGAFSADATSVSAALKASAAASDDAAELLAPSEAEATVLLTEASA